MTIDLFARPILVRSVSECHFYHVMDLPDSGPTDGVWDLRGAFDRYTGRVPLLGKTVLDIGTASGLLTFEAERRGAQVVSVGPSSAAVLDRLPMPQSLHSTNYPQWEHDMNAHLLRVNNAYWLAHREFRSRATVHYGNAYDLPPELGEFDVVMVGQVLVHLSDAIRALSSVAPRCRGKLIIAEGMVENEQPISHFLGRARRPDNDAAFWHHSTGFYRELMAMLGFALESTATDKYRCNAPGWADAIDITTLVFQRVQPDPRSER